MRRTPALFLILSAALAAADKPALLAVFAHPDDETTVGPLLARYAAEGHPVWLVSMTSGQKGVTPHGGIPAGDQLGKAREAELRCSASALGIREPILLGYQDQGISLPPEMEAIAGKLREIINRTKPDVILTWGPDGLTGHPDHRAASSIATQVFQQQALLEWKPKKLYYVAWPESRFARPVPPFIRPGAIRYTADRFLTTRVDGRRHLDTARAAIQCHKTQWTPERMKDMDALNREGLGGNIYLRLALPPSGAARETGVFDP
jgi:LmbE family N-acetylglucosaminyl deacetylase